MVVLNNRITGLERYMHGEVCGDQDGTDSGDNDTDIQHLTEKENLQMSTSASNQQQKTSSSKLVSKSVDGRAETSANKSRRQSVPACDSVLKVAPLDQKGQVVETAGGIGNQKRKQSTIDLLSHRPHKKKSRKD